MLSKSTCPWGTARPCQSHHRSICIAGYDAIDVLICADGFGPPLGKMSKYNAFMSDRVQ